jgi:lipid-A-disaccharide synthase-like uncharacterized protein
VRLPNGKRLKWEPAALMLLVLGLGIWLAVGPASGPRFDVPPGAGKLKIIVGDVRGIVQTTTDPAGATRFVVRFPGFDTRPMTEAEFRTLYPPRVVEEAVEGRRYWLYSIFNITSPWGLVWIGIGLGGQLAFTGRMFLQWLTSERKRQSVITESFWWFSLIGGVALFSYFVWRQDPVGILGQATGIVIYARNLRLIHKHKRREARAASAIAGGTW